ncbi:hypothetical protein [uncultured Fibrobacter sp.]|uniref:hypothetical protein n=1 Tax=uncultured Fibrobacter sp. TaxID=261512 RepID=UPI0026314618|nr:hypothetical protein [uncultured Fibrobacter sp.]
MADKVLSFLNSLIDAVKIAPQSKFSMYYNVDGTIIGNGSQDFTKTYRSYNFIINGVSAQLIDIPGIEGKETNFVEIIKEALKKAHLVCYVAREAKGIESNTLEKIQSYLGKNVDVLGIHNIPLSPQKKYDGDDYVKDMLKKVKGELRKNCNIENALLQKISNELYMGTVGCAVLPALCGLSLHDGNSSFANPAEFEDNKEVQESLISLHRQQQSFLLHATDKELLQISNMASLKKAITQSCMNAPNRMRKNAFCRLQNVLGEGFLASIQEQQKAWKTYRIKAERSANTLIAGLDDAKKRFHRNMTSAVRNAIKDFYNDEILENIFFPSIEENAKIVREDIERRFKNAKRKLNENLKKKISDVMKASCEDYFERVKAYADDFVHSMTLQLKNLKAEMPSMEDTSFDWGGLGDFAFGVATSAASGAALGAWIGTHVFPVVGTALGAGIGAGLGALWGTVKGWIKYGFREKTRIMNFKKLAQEKVEDMAEKTWEELKPTIEEHVQSVTKAGDNLSAKALKVKEDAQITENLLTNFDKEIKKIQKNIIKKIDNLEVSNVA